ncbi:MAG: hypothetical protein HRU33_18165 [Rhodobacteraceae bacterium]|nr:hypothetical protein [Paracoccaceae bacterium]
MKLQRIFEHLSKLSNQRAIPQGVNDEGRIFALGQFDNADQLHGRVIDVVEGLKDHVGQPFGMHPWAYVISLSTAQQDGEAAAITFVDVVWPQKNGSAFVNQYIAMPRYLRLISHFIFEHTPSGTTVKARNADQIERNREDHTLTSLYPLAIAMLNTRGCRVDLKRAPSIINAKRKRQGKFPIPGHYDVDAADYITALRSVGNSSASGCGHASPIPHLRRAHERELSNGKRIWVSSALVNVRNEGDISFVERRKSYRNDQK